MRFVASMPIGSGIVFDYPISPSMLNSGEQMVFDSLVHSVALAGEPFQTFFDPCFLKNTLQTMGFGKIEDIEPEEMDSLYFRGQTDESRVGRLAHVIHARIG